ncbi:hypothetical protein F3Y22_tig00110831pilonHSYRG00396 [Hibiscus syriacus]|uniref:Uncharacterized protein n=1 Tax=Hibiscus syriacus TaxID=106335 RepID=A0A6A2ZMF9_HIBSY|nr:hypothetical protein F3Y22_tig00110831pilonHSYRG00396 [Hibiscus syriacus]
MDHTDADNDKSIDECHKVHNVDESDILVGKLFSSRDQAWYFYKGFAQEHRFNARRGTTWLDMEGNVKTQEFCCSKEGFRESKVNTVDRQRAHTPITRTGCKAKVIVTTTNTNDQAVSKVDIYEATTLKEVGVDLYNALQRGKAKEIIDGDVNALIAYFDYKKHDDPRFFVTYSVDESEALHNLIWSDSTSRSDYICFDDVIAFDTTCKDNLSMMNKSPISVVTDGDKAIQRAIKSVIPNAKHILCSWHLSRNAQANIGDPKFTTAFSKCMASWWTTGEFDIQWRSVVSEFNVKKHPWVIEKGNTRHLWAQAYLTGHFFANIRSTQRCESMNASLAIALKHKKTYLDVVRVIEDGISRMHLNELKADYLNSQTKPFQITKLVEFESHASEIFTRKSFHAFQEELQRETLYRIQEEIQSLSDECQYFYLKSTKKKIGLKHLDYTYLPGSLIQSRWTKDAKASAPSFDDLNVPQEIMQMERFAFLRVTASMLCYTASKTDASFKTARDEMKRLTEEFENSFGLNDSVN